MSKHMQESARYDDNRRILLYAQQPESGGMNAVSE